MQSVKSRYKYVLRTKKISTIVDAVSYNQGGFVLRTKKISTIVDYFCNGAQHEF